MAKIAGLPVAFIAAGGVLVWSGVENEPVTAVFRSLAQGKAPAKGSAEPFATAADTTSASTAPADGQVPAAGPGGFTHGQLEALWILAGGSPSAADNAACHAIQESSGRASVTSSNPDGGMNVGLWQLDTLGKGAGYTVAQLQNPLTNARVTVKATSGGADWSAWSTPGC
jgi:hypothetical protein